MSLVYYKGNYKDKALTAKSYCYGFKAIFKLNFEVEFGVKFGQRLVVFWSHPQVDANPVTSTHELTGMIVMKKIENKNRSCTIGFTVLYFKMAVMSLVLGTKMADVCKLISLGNLLARKTTWLVLTTTSATLIWSRVFGAYCMTNISINTLIFQHSFPFHCNFQGEHSHHFD